MFIFERTLRPLRLEKRRPEPWLEPFSEQAKAEKDPTKESDVYKNLFTKALIGLIHVDTECF